MSQANGGLPPAGLSPPSRLKYAVPLCLLLNSPAGRQSWRRKAKEDEGKAGTVVEKIPDTCVHEAQGVREGPAGEGEARSRSRASCKFLTLLRTVHSQPPRPVTTARIQPAAGLVLSTPHPLPHGAILSQSQTSYYFIHKYFRKYF